MNIKIKKLNENAVIPSQAKEGDFCYDVVAVSCKRVGWRTWEYGLGFAYEIDRKLENLGEFTVEGSDGQPATFNMSIDLRNVPVKLDIDCRPRSSIWKTGMILVNSTGTWDEFYRGEAKCVFYHFNIFKKKYKVGDRIGQIKLGITLPLTFKEVKKINMNTERGQGGFGSTGK